MSEVDVMERDRAWRIVRRVPSGLPDDDWHVAEGPDPGDDPAGVEVVEAAAYRRAVSRAEQYEALIREMLRDEPVRRRWQNRALALVDHYAAGGR